MPSSDPSRRRPTERERREAALELLKRYGSQIMATARRYSRSNEDAEDAYQRGIEIMLAKAPVTDLDELVPWLRTVIKHEAFAITRKQGRSRPVGDEVELLERTGTAASAADQAIVREELDLAARALGELKPQEAQALRLQAEGLSYKEICAEMDWTYTKVNRCLTEGRASLRSKMRGPD